MGFGVEAGVGGLGVGVQARVGGSLAEVGVWKVPWCLYPDVTMEGANPCTGKEEKAVKKKGSQEEGTRADWSW